MCSPPSPDLRIRASPALPGVHRVGVDEVMLGYVDAVEGVLISLEQSTGVDRRAQQIGTFAKCGVVLGGDQDGIVVLGDDLDGVVVLVDLLDQRKQPLACLARGDRHDSKPFKWWYKIVYHLRARPHDGRVPLGLLAYRGSSAQALLVPQLCSGGEYRAEDRGFAVLDRP